MDSTGIKRDLDFDPKKKPENERATCQQRCVWLNKPFVLEERCRRAAAATAAVAAKAAATAQKVADKAVAAQKKAAFAVKKVAAQAAAKALREKQRKEQKEFKQEDKKMRKRRREIAAESEKLTQQRAALKKLKVAASFQNEALVMRIAIDAQRIECEETDRCGTCNVGWLAWETAAVYDPDPAIAESLLTAQKRSSKFFGWKVRGRQDKTYVCPRCALQNKVVARTSDRGRMARSKAGYNGRERMVPG